MPYINIEISGLCNAKCPYCAHTRRLHEGYRGAFMSAAMFQSILDNLIRKKAINDHYRETDAIDLFNWGEPFLHPDINSILKIVQDHKLQVNISSNFIVKSKIQPEYLRSIKNVIFSLSGFSQQTYSRIHGANFQKSLSNFECLARNVQKFSPSTTLTVAWHRYTFNESEFWTAHRHFSKMGVRVDPVIAYLNDGQIFLEYIKGISTRIKPSAINDLMMERIVSKIDSNLPEAKNYECLMHSAYIYDENGKRLKCCTFTEPKSPCTACTESGLSWYLAHPITSYPSGGGTYGIRARAKHSFIISKNSMLTSIGHTLRRTYVGTKLVHLVKR